jgi:hypothetical protein
VAHTGIDLDEGENLMAWYAASALLGEPSQNHPIYGDSSPGRIVKLRGFRSALVRGQYWTSGSTDTNIAIAANAGATRYDLIVLRLNKTDWEISAEIVEGVSGNPPPALTQDTGSTGEYEIPLAIVTVTNGASVITAAQVQTVAPYIGARNVSVRDAAGLAYVDHYRSQLVYQEDTKQIFWDDGTNFRILAEQAGAVGVSAGSAGWGLTFTTVHRRNGFVTLKLNSPRSVSTATQGSIIAIIPDGYRPPTGHDIVCVVHGTGGIQPALCNVSAAGALSVAIANPIAPAYTVYGSITYPAA